MIQVNERSFFSFILFLFSVILLVNSSEMQGNAILVPRIIGYVLLVTSGVQFLFDLFPGIKNRMTFLSKQTESATDSFRDNDHAEPSDTVGSQYLFIGWMGLFVLLIFFTSMIWATLISFFLYLKWIAKESWKLTILYSSIFVAAIYFIFVVGMGVYYFL